MKVFCHNDEKVNNKNILRLSPISEMVKSENKKMSNKGKMTLQQHVKNIINIDLFNERNFLRVFDGFDLYPTELKLELEKFKKTIYFDNLAYIMSKHGFLCEFGYMKIFDNRKLLKITDLKHKNYNVTTIHFLKNGKYKSTSMKFKVYKCKITGFITIKDNFIMD